MKIVTPAEFQTAFLDTVREREGEVIKHWQGAQSSHTQEMIGEVLPRIASKLNLQSYAGDYYTLDTIFYSDKDVKHFPEASTYAKSIAVALEHENVLKGSCVEMNKLQLFNAPLKVLITYARAGFGLEEFLQKYAEIVRDADVFGDFSNRNRQLVIFGDLVDGSPTWKFFVYQDLDFIPIGAS